MLTISTMHKHLQNHIHNRSREVAARYRVIRVLIMGSLMAGWSTRSRDMKSEKLCRNKSLIKEEIEAYWKTKKTLEEGQHDVISDARSESQEQDVNGGGARIYTIRCCCSCESSNCIMFYDQNVYLMGSTQQPSNRHDAHLPRLRGEGVRLPCSQLEFLSSDVDAICANLIILLG